MWFHSWFRISTLLGGSWVVISGAISPLICIVTLLITPFITTHEPPSKALKQVKNAVKSLNMLKTL